MSGKIILTKIRAKVYASFLYVYIYMILIINIDNNFPESKSTVAIGINCISEEKKLTVIISIFEEHFYF